MRRLSVSYTRHGNICTTTWKGGDVEPKCDVRNDLALDLCNGVAIEYSEWVVRWGVGFTYGKNREEGGSIRV